MFAVVPMWVNDGAVWVAFIGGLLSLFGAIWVFSRRTMKLAADTFTERVDAVLEVKLIPIREKQDLVMADVKEIREQMHPNHGNSLRDRVNTLTDAAGIAPGFHDPTRDGDPA